MKHFVLIRAALERRLPRTILTGLSIMVAFLLFGVMGGVISSFDDALGEMNEARLRVTSKANFTATLPIAHLERIRAVEGVRDAAPIIIWPVYFQAPTNQISGAAVELDSFAAVMPETIVSAEGSDAMARNRLGATVGSNLAERFDWQLGDRVPLNSLLIPRDDGTTTWEVEIVSIHTAAPGANELYAGEIYLNYEYLNESRGDEPDTVHMFIVTVDDPAMAGTVARRIDETFANSADETSTQNEKQMFVNRMRQIGDIRSFVLAILSAVLFTLLFVIGSTMVQSARDRIAEFGVLKAMGYSDNLIAALVLVESVMLTLAGALLGMIMAAGIFPGVFSAMGLGEIPMTRDIWLNAIGMAVGLGAAVAIWPALQAQRLSVTNALRRGG